MHDVVLALGLDEVHPRDLMPPGEGVHLLDEAVGDLSQRRSRGDRQPELLVDEADQPARVLQPRNVDVAVHPVNALNLESDVLG